SFFFNQYCYVITHFRCILLCFYHCRGYSNCPIISKCVTRDWWLHPWPYVHGMNCYTNFRVFWL
uniref:Uncharacterized protein n=1 Tax=Solanum lycopersicum TaxID=4081 RepID=A0A3Q7HUQ5_SOLLC